MLAGGHCRERHRLGVTLSDLSISHAGKKGGKCVGVKREFGAIGRSRVRYAAAAEALALIARLAGQ
jgi:hypothetical protein